KALQKSHRDPLRRTESSGRCAAEYHCHVITARLSLARKRLILRLDHGSQAAMTVARFPQLAHWGAFTALGADGRVVGCEAFARDRHPREVPPAVAHPGARHSRRLA